MISRMDVATVGAAMIFGLAGVGCGDGIASDVGEARDRGAFNESDDKVKFSLSETPSGGPTFNFCGQEPAGSFDLNTAAWLTFFAGNEYAHFGYLGPLLNELGFGRSGLDTMWEQCAIDLYAMRAFEDDYDDEIEDASEDGPAAMRRFVADHLGRFGECADKWHDETRYDGTLYPVASFERWLVQTPRPQSDIQFFGGGKVKRGGSFFQEGSTQVMYMRHSERPVAIISFRGTETSKWLDIAADAVALQVAYASGEVHEGIFNAFGTVTSMLDMTLDQLEGTDVAIYVTGHSLGGGLATLLTQHIMHRIDDGDALTLRGCTTSARRASVIATSRRGSMRMRSDSAST